MSGAANNQHVLITGGAGFVGTNVARSCLARGQSVVLLDNLTRAGGADNVRELRRDFPGCVEFIEGDVRDRSRIAQVVANASEVYHLAAQVAVTTSLADPVGDLETNLLGTINVLEAVRRNSRRPTVLFTSTNKVYGKLGSLDVRAHGNRYEPVDEELAGAGISERQPLEFLSPYGCSKGGADQYVLDYAHSFGVRACVFRMSCIYGTYQLGSEDQGWVAHFLRQALKGEPITIFGDGRQVRDLLFVDDLVEAMRLAHENMDVAAGEAFNMGGGPPNSVSLLEVLAEINRLIGHSASVDWGAERLADQRWFVADTSKFRKLLGWKPRFSVEDGLRALYGWYQKRPYLIEPAGIEQATAAQAV